MDHDGRDCRIGFRTKQSQRCGVVKSSLAVFNLQCVLNVMATGCCCDSQGTKSENGREYKRVQVMGFFSFDIMMG